MSCDCSDAIAPSCSTTMVRRARKSHRCEECRRPIRPGTRYEYVSGIWDGEADSHRTCLRCVRVREIHGLVTGDDCWTYGELMETVRDSLGSRRRFRDVQYRDAFRVAWLRAKSEATGG